MHKAALALALPAAGIVLACAALLAACGGKEKPAAVAEAPAPPPPPDAAAASEMEQGTATPKPAEAEWKTLVDFDARAARAPVPKPETFAKFTDAKFKTYRKAKKDCKGQNDAVISVDGGLQGAFTKKDAAEVLYLVNIVPCDEKSGAEHTLLILQGGHVNVNEKVSEHEIVEVKDLDQDGDNEILLVGGWPPQVKARLVDTEDGKLETLFDFGEVAKGSCEGGSATGESAVIRYRKGGTSMEYKAERKPKTCPTAK
jgi:hypothetical protein